MEETMAILIYGTKETFMVMEGLVKFYPLNVIVNMCFEK